MKKRPCCSALGTILGASLRVRERCANRLVLHRSYSRAKYPLATIEGRIDHMALDAKRERLFVAELGNDTVAVVSLPDRKVVRVIDSLKEPQGVGYLASPTPCTSRMAGTAPSECTTVPSYTLRRRLDLKDDADNIRVDPRRQPDIRRLWQRRYCRHRCGQQISKLATSR